MSNFVGPNAMSKQFLSHLLLSSALAAVLAMPAFAQSTLQPTPPAGTVRETIDENSVDLSTGNANVQVAGFSIGEGDTATTFSMTQENSDRFENLKASINASGWGPTANLPITVTIGDKSDKFNVDSTTTNITPVEGNGSKLSYSNFNYVYERADGLQATFFSDPTINPSCVNIGTRKVAVKSIKYANGYTLNYNYTVSPCIIIAAGYPRNLTDIVYRLNKIDTNANQSIQYIYSSNSVTTTSGVPYWLDISGVNACQLSAGVCSKIGPSASTNYQTYYSQRVSVLKNGNVTTYSNQSNDATVVTKSVSSLSVRTPGRNADNMVYSIDANNRVVFSTVNGVTTNYAYSDSGNIRTTTRTANSASEIFKFDIPSLTLLEYTDQLNRKTVYTYNSLRQLSSITYPEGNKVQYTRDARGNATETRLVSKTPGTPPDIVTTANYDTTCVSLAKCNKPNWATDAKGNQTDYGYDTTHGGITTATLPAASAGGVRPQTRYSYTAIGGISKLTGASTCSILASCAGTADEKKTTIAYNSYLLPTTVTAAAGDGSTTSTTATGYDVLGNAVTVDGPLAGSADTTTYRYDLASRLIGVVGADPDGAGTRIPVAQRLTYNGQGIVSNVETGNVTDTSDAAWSAMTISQSKVTTYDNNGRAVRSEIMAGGTTYAVNQTNYDALGRVNCTVQRMDPAVWASQTDACVPQTTSGNGPDRVVKQIYNAASEVTQIQTAVGTTDVSNEKTLTFTNNGEIASLKDAENNLTTYEYDGHDRLLKTRYPVATLGAASSSTTDYEQLTYDANGNVTQQRLRDGTIIGLAYDNLNRLTLKDTPNAVHFDYDISYQFDLLGRLKTATTGAGHTNNFTYDALGRMTAQHMYNAATYNSYDIAGRRTRMTWSADGSYIDYDYDVTGNVTAIRENGATSGVGVLATYAYDNLGRRSSVTRGNGTVTTYGYDPASRLSSLAQDLGGSAHDQTTTLGYNPAGQIDTLTKTNDAYAWGSHYNINRAYGTNGLNQLTSAGATALGYDGRGNLTTSGSNSYSYTAENRMATAPGGIYIGYEPSGNQVLQYYNANAGSDTRFGWDGDRINLEIGISGNTVAILRRYVPGPGTDETVVWYEGAGLTDRRWLHTDERGSVTAITNSSGTAIAINTYDEYGIPAPTNIGRFQYTGQAWLAEIGMYYYKARIYSPTLGRFMRTDPIGYIAGANLYNYVESDPVNRIDPTGLIDEIVVTGTRVTTGLSGGAGGGGFALPIPVGSSCAAGVVVCTPGADAAAYEAVNRKEKKEGKLPKGPLVPNPPCTLAKWKGAWNAVTNPENLINDGLSAAAGGAANAGQITRAALPLGKAANLAKGSGIGAVVALGLQAASGYIYAGATNDFCKITR